MSLPSLGSPRNTSPAQTPQPSRRGGRNLVSATPLVNTPANSASNGRNGTPTSDRIISGRISKTPRKVTRRKEDVLSEKEKEEERRQLEDMDEEMKLFPGSASWADDEVKLFKVLYMRQYSPLLPSHWDMDFRGIPIPDLLFASSDAHPPIITSQSGNDFKATKALTKLIDLTALVRGFVQSGQRHRARLLIDRELREYTKWAAQDGGYDSLDYMPNIVIDIVDTSQTPQEIEEHMQKRLRIAAANQRGHWRVERASEDGIGDEKQSERKSNYDPEEAEAEDNQVILVPDKYPTSSPQKPAADRPTTPPQNGNNNITASSTNRPNKDAGSATAVQGDDAECFTRRPPVIYGLFIVNTSVMVLTIDSAKEKNAVVSYQVEVGFNKRYQGVWNAITIAIVVCLARDAMMEMKGDFDDSIINGESDPDA